MRSAPCETGSAKAEAEAEAEAVAETKDELTNQQERGTTKPKTELFSRAAVVWKHESRLVMRLS